MEKTANITVKVLFPFRDKTNHSINYLKGNIIEVDSYRAVNLASRGLVEVIEQDRKPKGKKKVL